MTSTELQKNTRNVIDWARTKGDTIIVETYGKPMVIILDIEECEKFVQTRREHIRQRSIEFLERAREATRDVPPEEVEHLVNEACQAARFSYG